MTVVDRALTDLRRLLSSDRFPPKTRLPPERQLAQELGVSRSLLRDALATLEAEGRIWRHVGKGTFAGGRPIRVARDLELLSGMTSPAEVMEVRLSIEPYAAAQAALRATQEDIGQLRHCLGKLESASNHSNYGRWDSTFHRTIVEAARNSLLLALFDAVNAVRSQGGWTRMWQRAVDDARRGGAQEHHQNIVRAIAERRPDEAYDAMRRHISSVREWVFEGDRPGSHRFV